MNYRYKRFQIFRKRLPIPKEARNRIYERKATIQDFIDYDLINKVPVETLHPSYRDIASIIGVDKALDLDWQCVLALKSNVLMNWFQTVEKNQSGEELNKSLYVAIKDDYFQMLERSFPYASDYLIKNLDHRNSQYDFSSLGEKFAEFAPELTYTTDFYTTKKLLSKWFSLGDYIEEYSYYKNVPASFIQQALHSETDKKLFEYLYSYIKDENSFKKDELLFHLAFNNRYHYEYEKYLKILEEKKPLNVHDFLEEACILRIEDQRWLKPNSSYISKYNVGKEKKFTFGQKLDVDVLSLIDQYPEYRSIFSQLLSYSTDFQLDVHDYNSIEDFIADLIVSYHLYYDAFLPEKFQVCHPELFLSRDCKLKEDFYRKKMHPKLIQEYPECIEFFKDKSLFLGFQDKEMAKFIQEIGNSEFLELCLKYGKHLVPVKKEREDQSYEELLKKEIISKITSFSCSYGDLQGVKTIVDEIPSYFLGESFPEKLKNLFYERELTPKILQENQKWCHLLKDKELGAGLNYQMIDLYKLIGKEDFIILCQNYGKYLEKISFYSLNDIFKENLLENIEDKIYKCICESGMFYDEDMPQSFKEKYPQLFLPMDTPEEIKRKFYNREFQPFDFQMNPNLLSYFEEKDVGFYLAKDYSWLNEKFQKIVIDNKKKIRIASSYKEITDYGLKSVFRDYILNEMEEKNFDKIDLVDELLFAISYSNSSEILACRVQLANQLLQSDNPKEKLDKIEKIFLENDLPTVGKRFFVFQTLHPGLIDFDFSEMSTVSPILKGKSNKGRENIIFSDLLKIAFGSNNRSIKTYLENLEIGNDIFLKLTQEDISVDQLDSVTRENLMTFLSHLNTLYNNALLSKGRTNNLSDNIEYNIKQMQCLFSENNQMEYNLPDRIVKMFCHFAGFDSYHQAKEYFIQKTQLADFQNRKFSKGEITLEKGDFIKGIRQIGYLKNILQNGSIAVEHLGASAGKDRTPLDTDLSRVLVLKNTLSETIQRTEAGEYGPIWFVLKNDDRFTFTRRSPEDEDQTVDTCPNLNSLEIFYTGVTGKGHYGVRTGFASTEINYIITENVDDRVGLEVAMNGFYIPVIDIKGNLIFTEQDYDELRNKMSGLKFFDMDTYYFSDSLVFPEIEELITFLPSNDLEVSKKRKFINDTISRAMNSINLSLKTVIDGDLTEGSVEFIDTGSTGRGTNIPGDGDFDFLMRMDKKRFIFNVEMEEVKDKILEAFKKDSTEVRKEEMTSNGDFRLKKVLIEGVETPLDIDISFVEKTDKLDYSTDMCLKERLNSIRLQSPEKYPLVLANIIFAKKILSNAKAYKSRHAKENPQGGLGGVGIENWILQSGGSFIEAAENFMKVAEGKNFEEFQSVYKIWDFGENHFAEKKGFYPHDNFVQKNMNEEGYNKMKKALKKYLQYFHIQTPSSEQKLK